MDNEVQVKSELFKSENKDTDSDDNNEDDSADDFEAIEAFSAIQVRPILESLLKITRIEAFCYSSYNNIQTPPPRI